MATDMLTNFSSAGNLPPPPAHPRLIPIPPRRGSTPITTTHTRTLIPQQRHSISTSAPIPIPTQHNVTANTTTMPCTFPPTTTITDADSSLTTSPTGSFIDTSPLLPPMDSLWLPNSLAAQIQLLNVTSPNICAPPLDSVNQPLMPPGMYSNAGMGSLPLSMGPGMTGGMGMDGLGGYGQMGVSPSQVYMPPMPFPMYVDAEQMNAPSTVMSLLQPPIMNNQPGSVSKGSSFGLLIKQEPGSQRLVPHTPEIKRERVLGTVQESVQKRKAHLAAEKRRRGNLGRAFEDLRKVVPACRIAPHFKNSKETMVRKAIEYINYLNSQRGDMAEEIRLLRQALDKNGLKPPSEIGHARKSSHSSVCTEGTCTTLEDSDSEMEEVEVKARDNNEKPESIPQETRMLLLLSLLDSFFDEYVTRVNIESPEALSVSLLTFLQQHMTPEKLSASLMAAIENLSKNFNPQTDGSNLRIRKWADGLNECCPATYPEAPATRVRQILLNVANFLEY
eukprot:comp21253_c0_seq1/m.28963 comp21253_c0_seq1/g.28963  ORF comp21253_c0_seq1/g.28963 comp21253_c0_seq1/m.28963 type:complete len:504 (-) comp21253_c0_seq1:181-1692(-)